MPTIAHLTCKNRLRVSPNVDNCAKRLLAVKGGARHAKRCGLRIASNFGERGATLLYSRLAPAGARASCGGMSEWLKEHDWKSCVPFLAVPRVQIPIPPPVFLTYSIEKPQLEHLLPNRDLNPAKAHRAIWHDAGRAPVRARGPRDAQRRKARAGASNPYPSASFLNI